MSWEIIGGRIAFKSNDRTIYPSADDIFALNRNDIVRDPALVDLPSPAEVLPIRFSRICESKPLP